LTTEKDKSKIQRITFLEGKIKKGEVIWEKYIVEC
jgi:hypothetical protein